MKHKHSDHLLSKRLARRWKILQVLGAVLMVLAYAVNWTPSDDAAIPQTRPFMLFLGVTLFVAGLIMTWRCRENGQ
ncbi:MAG: hypothetical protein ICV76_02135 [Nitrospiraceae bacterium]|jgi:type VI protein secretion system component VasK|nr:hypothetical protein [Nitrospiraceae bacterium]